MPDDNLYPIDEATAQESKATFNDAALLAQLGHVPNATGFVVGGLAFSADLDASPPLLTVSGGWARMYDPQGPTRDHTTADPSGPQAITVLDQTLPLQIGQRTGLELEPNAENYVYLTGDRSGVADNDYEIRSVENDPDGLSLLVGVVDTSAATADEAIDPRHRFPEGEFESAKVMQAPSEPTDVARKADLADATTANHDHAGDTLGTASNPVTATYTGELSVTGGVRGTQVGPSSGVLQNQRREWSWSDITWEDKGAPIIDGQSTGVSSPDGACYPTVIKGDDFFTNPIDSYYLYWSGHDGPTGIHLSTAPELWGPWTFHSEVITAASQNVNHVASPCAIIDPERGRLNLYAHMNGFAGVTGQSTHLFTTDNTDDGTTFVLDRTILEPNQDGTWDDRARTYFQVARIGSEWWGVYQGGDDPGNSQGIGVARSSNGEDWVVDSSPAFDSTQWTQHNPQGFSGSGPSISTIGGTPTIHYRDAGSDSSMALPLSAKDTAPFASGETVYTTPPWDTRGVDAYEFCTDDEFIYLFYYLASDGDLDIGMARTPLAEVGR